MKGGPGAQKLALYHRWARRTKSGLYLPAYREGGLVCCESWAAAVGESGIEACGEGGCGFDFDFGAAGAVAVAGGLEGVVEIPNAGTDGGANA